MADKIKTHEPRCLACGAWKVALTKITNGASGVGLWRCVDPYECQRRAGQNKIESLGGSRD